MQQILDRTQESLAQAFASLSRNARRQQLLFHATIGVLVAIVVLSCFLLASLAAARHLDNRRNDVAQYVSSITLLLQGEFSFLRRAELTVRYYRDTDTDRQADAATVQQIRRHGAVVGVSSAPGGRYELLVPGPTRDGWGGKLPHRVWQLQQTATAMLATQQAFQLQHHAYAVGLDHEYALVLATADAGRAPLQPDTALATRLRDTLTRELHAQTGRDVPARNEQVWIGPHTDPILGIRVMTAITASYAGNTPTMLIAASVPVEQFLGRLQRPAEPATLVLANAAGQAVDVSPPAPDETVSAILARARHMPSDRFQPTWRSVQTMQPLKPFGSLIYYLPLATLASALTLELSAIAGIGLLLIAVILMTARYWDIHVLRQSHAEAARSLENETINHILVSATPIGLCVVGQRDYAILTANALAVSLLHLGESTVLPPHLVSAFQAQPPETSTTPLASIRHFIVPATPAPAAPPGTAGPDNDGVDRMPRFVQITYAPARYRGDDVYFCAIHDVTAQHELEARLRAAKQAAEAAMRARSNFFAAMSHEIRTPLNALLGNLELLSRSPAMARESARLKTLDMAAEGLRRIVNDILDFSKLDAGEMRLVAEPFRPIDDLEKLACSYAPMVAGRAIRFYSHLSPTLTMALTGDRTRLVQIVNNLLSNAFKFTSCGKITLAAVIEIDAQGRAMLVCRVCDSGMGMPPSLVAQIFRPFVQGGASHASRHGGTGLGLSICARLCELMGGQISVESVQGVGSAFTVAVPLGVPAGGDRFPAPVPARPGTLLVLCHETDTADLVEDWLSIAGWGATSLHTLAAARDFLRVNRPLAVVATGECTLDELAALREVQPVNVVWITRDGPDRPTMRATGIIEITEFSHRAFLASVDMAVGQLPADAGAPATAPIPDAPAQDDDVTAQSGAPGDGPEGSLETLDILVAEDNPLNQMLITEQLEALGCQPLVVSNGRQALAVLENTTVDVVLTDVHMPVMDGYELLAALQASHPGLPVLAFSAVTNQELSESWSQRGFAGYIGKPASLQEIEATLRPFATHRQPGSADIGEASPAAEAPRGAGLSPADRARYDAILREHLRTDLPELAAILASRDTEALRGWAHRSAGAFLIVQQTAIAAQCRELEHLCENGAAWSPEIAAQAEALQQAARQYADACATQD